MPMRYGYVKRDMNDDQSRSARSRIDSEKKNGATSCKSTPTAADIELMNRVLGKIAKKTK